MNNPLIGKTITAIHLTPDRWAIKFVFNDGPPLIAFADSDHGMCPGVSSVEMLPSGFPFTVLEVEVVPMPDGKLQVGNLGLEIKTDKGSVLIDHSKKSDKYGYWGGYMMWPGDARYAQARRYIRKTEVWQDSGTGRPVKQENEPATKTYAALNLSGLAQTDEQP